MIYILHGDNQQASRQAFNQLLSSFSNANLLRLDAKEVDFDQTHSFLQGTTLISGNKTLAISNFFSLSKSLLDKLKKLLLESQDLANIILWQNKTLKAPQLKSFPKAKVELFRLDNNLFKCLNSVRPHQIKYCLPLYHQVIDSGLYDLFLYLLKNNLRKQLTSYTRFDPKTLKTSYLQLIELDFQNKTGQLSIPKEIALERILINLTK